MEVRRRTGDLIPSSHLISMNPWWKQPSPWIDVWPAAVNSLFPAIHHHAAAQMPHVSDAAAADVLNMCDLNIPAGFHFPHEQLETQGQTSRLLIMSYNVLIVQQLQHRCRRRTGSHIRYISVIHTVFSNISFSKASQKWLVAKVPSHLITQPDYFAYTEVVSEHLSWGEALIKSALSRDSGSGSLCPLCRVLFRK